MTRLQVVKPTELGLTPRKVTRSFSCKKHAKTIRSQRACYSVGVGNKVPGIETELNSYFPDEGRAVYTSISSMFNTGSVLHSLIAVKWGGSCEKRRYIKGRNLCVSLDVQITFHSATSWIYQVLVLFITLINTKQ